MIEVHVVSICASDGKLVLMDHLVAVLDDGCSIRVHRVLAFCLMFSEILLVCTCPLWYN